MPQRSIVTPAAWDVARQRRLAITRHADEKGKNSGQRVPPHSSVSPVSPRLLLIVVRHTDAVERFWDELRSTCRRELLSCPDDAAALAVSTICRGDAEMVEIFAEQTYRAACRANRNERVKAVAVRDAGDVRNVRTQLKANVWCVDPTGRSWFELRQLHRAIVGDA
ncbi:MAG: hypothetical protein KF861_00795 [Planctomycetaceae bacterium]|nr:hypothetical protein [Planctomycetaceae bacterium]